MRKVFFLLLGVVFLCGCGSSGDGVAREVDVATNQFGQIRLNLASETIPEGTDEVEIIGFNEAGQTVYGPNLFNLVPTDTTLDVPNVPVSTTTLTGELLDGEVVVGTLRAENILVGVGGTVTANAEITSIP